MTERVLTGINTTGTLHLGNYCGALRPCVKASKNPDVESFFFLADLHALIKCQDPERLEKKKQQRINQKRKKTQRKIEKTTDAE